jgi:hypothetical protein
MRCYLCLEPTPPLQGCLQAPCAWAWHASCQRQRDLRTSVAALGMWTPVTCPSGHAQAGPPSQKRVRKQWTWWACYPRVDGPCSLVGAAWTTFCRWLVGLIVTFFLLGLVKTLVDDGILKLCAAFQLSPRDLLRAWHNVLLRACELLGYWTMAVAAVNFWDRIAVCWRLRTVDYV